MPIIIDQIKGALDEDKSLVIKKALKTVNMSENDILSADINKISLDARKQNDIHFVYSIYVKALSKNTEKKICRNKNCRYVSDSIFTPEISSLKRDGEVVIAGFGPAGMFCGLLLAEYGYRPVIIERGKPVDERIKDVEKYWKGGELNTESNVQFGEGGAGTFSDGKLTTRINDPLCRYVLEKFAEFGAPEEILIKAKNSLQIPITIPSKTIISSTSQTFFLCSHFTFCSTYSNSSSSFSINLNVSSLHLKACIFRLRISRYENFMIKFSIFSFITLPPRSSSYPPSPASAYTA